MKVAFLIPSTTNKRENWLTAEDTYLWNILCQTLEYQCPDHNIKLFIGYDAADRIYSDPEERLKFSAVFTKFELEWFPQGKEMKGKVTSIWNNLGKEALLQGYNYFKLLGDDIKMPSDTGWLGCFINKLKKNKNIGFSAGYSNNDNIPTQFLVHKTHFDIFGFFYPEEIPNYGCDDFMYQIYPEKYRTWLKSYKLYNMGGEPRYNIEFNMKFVEAVVKRYKPRLSRAIYFQ